MSMRERPVQFVQHKEIMQGKYDHGYQKINEELH